MHGLSCWKRLQVFAIVLAMAVVASPAFAQLMINSLTDATPGLSPNLAQVGSGALTLTIKGAGFSSNSTARLGTTNLATTYTDANTLTATIPASLLKAVGPQGVTVVDS